MILIAILGPWIIVGIVFYLGLCIVEFGEFLIFKLRKRSDLDIQPDD